MLWAFSNEKLNKRANDYFLMLFNIKDEDIENFGYKSAFLDIFPKHLVTTEIAKCKRIYNEIYNRIVDEIFHNDLRPIHEYVLYRLLEMQSEMESDDDVNYSDSEKDKLELEELRKTLSEEEREYLDNINNADFYLDFLFENNDFIYYENFYNTFGTEVFNRMEYDERLIELLPKDKRKELKQKMKEHEQREGRKRK